jgi:nonribosomal peptide synthetase MxcG
VSRAALASFSASAGQCYGVLPSDRVLQFAPLAFDASVEELFVTLTSGAQLVLREPDMLDSPTHFLERCGALNLSVLDLPTAFFHELSFAMAHGNARIPACVHTVIIGGEAALPERVRDFLWATHHQVRLLNTYGPTEVTVVATCADLTHDADLKDGEQLPIGRPLPGVSAILVPNLSEDGVALYQLFLAGPTVATGYLGKPQLTAQRFGAQGGAARAYHTGDLVRLTGDGQLAFAGRSDDQLKISGHRVELGEVERALTGHVLVREVAVVVDRQGAQKRLVAHVVAASDLTVGALREHARGRLLAGAVPSAFVFHASLPRTPTGKIDRKALASMSTDSDELFTQDANDLERAVLSVWQEVLGTQAIDLDQDFFELGGQSLQSIQVASRLGVKLGREVTGALLFRHPTVRGLARALSTERPVSTSADARTQVLADTQATVDHTWGDATAAGHAVLLTGATGFLGTYLLHELLTQSEREIVCVVRGKDGDEARARLLDAMRMQQLSSPHIAQRVRVVVGDLSKPKLALSSDDFRALQRDCSTVIHNGASVSLARGYSSLRNVNVGAVRELLSLVGGSGGAAIHYVSTLATAMGANEDGTIEERFVDFHSGLRDGYSQSKWASEQLLSQAYTRGLNGRVFRLGRLVGPLGNATVNAEDLVWRMIIAGVRVGALPELDVREPWTPVDIVARLIVTEALREGTSTEARVLNVAPTSLTSLSDVVRWTRSYGYSISTCSPAHFVEALGSASGRIDPTTLAMFQAQEHTAIPSIRAIDTRACRQAMTRARLVWPEIFEPQVHRYLETCVANGLLGKPYRQTASVSSPTT